MARAILLKNLPESGLSMFTNHLGIDLGTANTLVFAKGQGVIINEPSVVAINTHSNKVMAVGDEAKQIVEP